MQEKKETRKLGKVIEEAKKRIVPDKEETRKVNDFVQTILSRIKEKIAEEEPIKPLLVGSIAKNTWIRGDRDIDIFLLFPPETKREDLKAKTLAIGRKITRNVMERFAEHPYVRMFINEFQVDLVPCYKVNSSLEIKSSVDRTPFHVEYVKKKTNEEVKNEIRLLKQFMKGINVYGAEAKVGGFSGYLCELLIIHAGSFIDLLRKATRWRRKQVIDIEGYYRGKDPTKIFQEPLIVVDPVDPLRNAAAAVTTQKMYEFISASSFFLENPSINFFFPPKEKTPTTNTVIDLMKNRETSFIFIVYKSHFNVSPEILHPQLKKTTEAMAKLLTSHDFEILDKTYWTNELDTAIFIIELQTKRVPLIKKHVGPKIGMKNQENFLKKYLVEKREEVISGPYIENERWIVCLKRKFTEATELLNHYLTLEKQELGLPPLIKKAESFKVLLNTEIKELMDQFNGFRLSLTRYLKRKPSWLQYIHESSF